MDNKQIKQLVLASVTEHRLDRGKVEKIAKLLTRPELKLYVKGLKRWIRENTVVVEVPRGKKDYQKTMQSIFNQKEIVVRQNPSLLLGIKIQDSDDIYEMSLQNTFKLIEEHVLETYDR